MSVSAHSKLAMFIHLKKVLVVLLVGRLRLTEFPLYAFCPRKFKEGWLIFTYRDKI